MSRSDVDEVLQLAERREQVARDLELVRTLEAEVARDEEVTASVPELVDALGRHTAEIAATARELERQWVAQGGLVTLWTRAAEQLQLAESAGVDPAPYRADVDRARRRVEDARQASDGQREVLARERSGVVGVLGELPIEIDPPADLRRDNRPEALRRDALELIDLADGASRLALDERQLAAERLEAARRKLGALEPADQLERELSDLDARLPEEVEVPAGAPPSTEMRLRRAGIGIAGGGG